MSIIYEARRLQGDNKHYWFITYDVFVYEASAYLAKRGDDFYGFPCYIKPARWFEILTNAGSNSVDINVFREVLLSPSVQRAADFLEGAVIAQILKSRIDQEVKDIQQLRYMFSDIINKPAVQDAYREMLKLKGTAAIEAAAKVKDKIIINMGQKVSKLETDLEEAQKTIKKQQKREKYLKKQLTIKSSSTTKKKGKK